MKMGAQYMESFTKTHGSVPCVLRVRTHLMCGAGSSLTLDVAVGYVEQVSAQD